MSKRGRKIVQDNGARTESLYGEEPVTDYLLYDAAEAFEVFRSNSHPEGERDPEGAISGGSGTYRRVNKFRRELNFPEGQTIFFSGG